MDALRPFNGAEVSGFLLSGWQNAFSQLHDASTGTELYKPQVSAGWGTVQKGGRVISTGQDFNELLFKALDLEARPKNGPTTKA